MKLPFLKAFKLVPKIKTNGNNTLLFKSRDGVWPILCVQKQIFLDIFKTLLLVNWG